MGVGSMVKMQIMVLGPADWEWPYVTFLEEHWNDVTNWDILRRDTWDAWADYVIDPNQYVSAPTSLRLTPPRSGYSVYALCNLAQALDLKNGKMVTWVRRSLGGVGIPKFYIGVTGPGDVGIDRSIEPPNVDEWSRWYIKWFQGKDDEGDPCTWVSSQPWVLGSDQPLHVWVAEPPMTGSTNRCGIGTMPQSLERWKWFDDTEVCLMP